LTQLAQPYRLKELYHQSIDSARQAMRLAPKVAEPHLWMADSLRLTGNYADARSEYNECLTLSDFDSKLAGQLNYNVLDFLAGFCNKETRRATEYLARPEKPGLFPNLRLRTQPRQLRFRHNCYQEALAYDAKDPYAHYALGLSYMRKAVQINSIAELDPALRHFQGMLTINPDLGEAGFALKNVANIRQAMLKSSR
jgi:tetratricopeptide (TPR) repeat protein